MAVSAFDQFVQEEQAKVSDLPFDPLVEKEQWLAHLNELHDSIEDYLSSYVAAGQIAIEYRFILLNEEYIGDYSAREMLIKIGTKTIRLDPVGTFLIGSKGRVDVIGPYARTPLLLMDSKVLRASDMFKASVSINGKLATSAPRESYAIEWVWRLISRPPANQITPLTKESFLSMIVEIANG